MKLLLTLLFIGLSQNAFAIGVDLKKLPDPVMEARAQHIMKELRCLVCQNQSIIESDAELAGDLRAIVREQVAMGKNHEQIIEFMTSRYGDWILLKPPFKASNAILWLGPIFLLLIGGFLVFRTIRQSANSVKVSPLSADEKERLKQIIEDRG
ncbi:Cytochrome c heme lyase subunit CcmL [hydrothermal vent metagenome]|uniref:Cytochrome c heme lyase subunit CcmL n=1 Tax=hydrothermal vent metagenome TaxID=652676 RepID=A0A3B0RI16_9ZZZZ